LFLFFLRGTNNSALDSDVFGDRTEQQFAFETPRATSFPTLLERRELKSN